jgi:hypothetical protein
MSQLHSFKYNREQTCLKRYGFKHVMQIKYFKERREQNCLKRYGVKHIMQLQSFKENREQTCLKRYGVKHISQYPGLIQKSYQFKIYRFPCGNETKVQGYENFALDILVKEGFTYNDILILRKDVPEVWYNFEGKRCRYFVDIYIPKLNKMIEVKSVWTINLHKEKINAKADRCRELGYDYEFWVFDNKKNLTKTLCAT